MHFRLKLQTYYMFKIKVSERIIQHCKLQVENHNFGQRIQANGTQEQQLTGIIGQSVVMNLFDLDLVNGQSGFDDGIDIEFAGFKIDVKTMGRTTDVRRNYTNNFLKLQDYFSTDIYIYCSYNKTNSELTVCGWIDKPTFIKRRKYYPKGTIRTRSDGSTFPTFSDLYEIDIVDLNDVQDANDLKSQLLSFSRNN
jgi:hypothetical protein